MDEDCAVRIVQALDDDKPVGAATEDASSGRGTNVHTGQSRGKLTYEAARRLAAAASFKHSEKDLETLKSMAANGDPGADFGMGQYYEWLITLMGPRGAKPFLGHMDAPLLLEVIEKVDSGLAAQLKLNARREKDEQKRVLPVYAAAQDAYRNMVQWYSVAAQHGEIAAQGKIGRELFSELMEWLTARSEMIDRGKSLSAADISAGDMAAGIKIAKPACEKALFWLMRSSSKKDSPRSATANAGIADVYLWSLINQNSFAAIISARSGCEPPGNLNYNQRMARFVEFMIKAAEMGDEDAIKVLVAKFHGEGDFKREGQWEEQLRRASVLDKELGLPDPCNGIPDCRWEKIVGTATAK